MSRHTHPLASVSKFTPGMTLWVVPHAGYSRQLSAAEKFKPYKLTVVSAGRRWVEVSLPNAGGIRFVDVTCGFMSQFKHSEGFTPMNQREIVYPSLVAYQQDKECPGLYNVIHKRLQQLADAKDHKGLVRLARELDLPVTEILTEEECEAALAV